MDDETFFKLVTKNDFLGLFIGMGLKLIFHWVAHLHILSESLLRLLQNFECHVQQRTKTYHFEEALH